MTQIEENIIEVPINISKESLLDTLNPGEIKNVSNRMKKAIDQAVEEIKNNAKGKILYKEIPLKKEGEVVLLDNKIKIRSKKLNSLLGCCNKALVFISTVGDIIEKKIKRHSKKSSYYGYILDKAASIAAEETAEYIQEYAYKKLYKSKGVTYRYSPGYCDWPIEEQQNLFKVVSHEKIGVKLSEASFMSPRKSVSGIIGVSDTNYTKKKGNACMKCSKIKCPYRRGKIQ